MGSSIIRQWHLLTLLPKGPRRIDTATLEQLLRARGLDVHRRTIQRDLVDLAAVFPIVSDERSKPYGWRWADHAYLSCSIPVLAANGASVVNGEIDLVLHVRAAAVAAVTEALGATDGATEVHVSARSSNGDGDVCLVQARVRDGCSLRTWLFGLADAAIVVAPAQLRAELAQRAVRAAAAYAQGR